MEYRQIYPNLRTLENFLIYHCQNKDIDEAVNLLESSSQSEQLYLNSRIAAALIHCHCSRKVETYITYNKANTRFTDELPAEDMTGKKRKMNLKKELRERFSYFVHLIEEIKVKTTNNEEFKYQKE